MSAQDNLNGQQFWHGTPDERTWEHGAAYGIHVGTQGSASQALHARIGTPAEGEWDGTREYGKTLLRGHPDYGIPQHYPGDLGRNASYSNGEKIPPDARPSVFPVEIAGEMSNTPGTPHEDFKANGYMRAQLSRGRARRGYYYTNVSEDEGSVSAVVPSAQHLRRLPRS